MLRSRCPCFARKTGAHRPWCARSPGRGFTGSPPVSGSPLSLAWMRALRHFAVLALACKPGARRPWRARSPGQTLRLRTPCCAWAPAQAVRGLGARRDNSPPDCCLCPAHPLDLCLDPPHPFRARSGPLFVFFASLSCFARKTGVRHSWRTRSPGRRFTGSPPTIRLAPRHLARRKAPKKNLTTKALLQLSLLAGGGGLGWGGRVLRLRPSLGLSKGGQTQNISSATYTVFAVNPCVAG